MSETEAMGGDPEAQAIMAELEADGGSSVAGTSTETPETPDTGAPAEPAHSDPQAEPKFIEIAGQKFKTNEDVHRWAERLFHRSAQQGRESADFRKKYERAIKFQERLEKDPEYLSALTKAETEYDKAKAAGASNQQAQKAALDTMSPEVKAGLERLSRIEQKEKEREAQADADRTVKEREKFEKDHPDLTPALKEKVVERMLHHADKYGVEVSYEDAYLEIQVEEMKAKNKALAAENRKVKADSDIGPGQGSPHTPRKRDLTREGTDDEFSASVLAELQAKGQVSSG